MTTFRRSKRTYLHRMQSSCNFSFDFIVRNNLRNLKLSSAADTDTGTSVSVVCDDNTVLELIVVELLVLDGPPLLILSSPFIPPPIVLSRDFMSTSLDPEGRRIDDELMISIFIFIFFFN